MKKKLLPYLQLCRAPALFSAWADVLVGARMTRHGWPPPSTLFWLLVATSGLYLSGMVFNDLADYREDLAERPNRPLPSGRVSKRVAWSLAVGLMLVGNVAAWQLGPTSGWWGILLSVCILAYDFSPRENFFAYGLMGTCRGLNLMLGVTTGTLPLDYLPYSTIAPFLIAYVLYIFGVTWFASHETASRPRTFLWGGIVCLHVAVILWTYLLCSVGIMTRLIDAGVGLLWLVLLNTDFRLWRLLREPTPLHVQQGVRTLLMAIIPQHAALTLGMTQDWSSALIVLALLFPARLLGRWMTIS